MGFLRKNTFWFFCALVVVGVVVFWGKWAREKANANTNLSDKLAKDLEELKGVADKKGEIKTPAFIKAAEDYKEKLRAEAAGLADACTGRQLNVEPDPAGVPPPLDNQVRFKEWLTARCKERCEEAGRAGMRCDRSDRVAHGDIPKDAPVEQKDIPLRHRQYHISREIHRILASKKVTVPCLKLSKTGEDEEVEGTQERGVQELRRIEWMSEGEMRARRRGEGQAGPGVSIPPPRFPRPYNAFLFELEFVAHFSLVPEVIRALEASENFFFIVRRADVGRMPDTSKRTRYVSSWLRRRREGSRREEFRNERYTEAPVRVILECEVLEFDFSKDPDPLGPEGGE